MWTEASYHVVLNKPFVEVNRCEERSRRHVVDSLRYSLIHKDNYELKKNLHSSEAIYLRNRITALSVHPNVTTLPPCVHSNYTNHECKSIGTHV